MTGSLQFVSLFLLLDPRSHTLMEGNTGEKVERDTHNAGDFIGIDPWDSEMPVVWTEIIGRCLLNLNAYIKCQTLAKKRPRARYT